MLSAWKSWLKVIKFNLDAFLIGAAMSWVMIHHTIQQRKELERADLKHLGH